MTTTTTKKKGGSFCPSICLSLCRSSCPCPPWRFPADQERLWAGGEGGATSHYAPYSHGRGGTGARGAGKKKRQQNILISHISLYLSPGGGRTPGGKRAAVPVAPMERNGVVSKVQVLPGQGTCPRARGRQEEAEKSERLPAAPVPAAGAAEEGRWGAGRLGSPRVF